jgi:phenylacetate-coenzyme A ligase PaaK-like adenylate-forming protein
LHLYEDLVVTEIVDERNRPVPVGTTGARLLVTVLFRTTQPLIRYEISDRVAALDGLCACGRPFLRIAGVEGREEDVLALTDDTGRAVRIHPNVFHTPLELFPVGGWQVVQTGPSDIRVSLAEPNDVDEAAVARVVRSSLERAGARGIRIEIQRVPAIPRTALGKAPLVVALR